MKASAKKTAATKQGASGAKGKAVTLVPGGDEITLNEPYGARLDGNDIRLTGNLAHTFKALAEQQGETLDAYFSGFAEASFESTCAGVADVDGFKGGINRRILAKRINDAAQAEVQERTNSKAVIAARVITPLKFPRARKLELVGAPDVEVIDGTIRIKGADAATIMAIASNLKMPIAAFVRDQLIGEEFMEWFRDNDETPDAKIAARAVRAINKAASDMATA